MEVGRVSHDGLGWIWDALGVRTDHEMSSIREEEEEEEPSRILSSNTGKILVHICG